MRLRLSENPGLLQFPPRIQTACTQTPRAEAKPAIAETTPPVRALAYRLNLLLSIWIGVYVLTDLLLQLAAPGLFTGMTYLFLGLALIARYPLWTHDWFVPATPMLNHLVWLSIGLLLVLIGSMVFPGHPIGFLAILAVEGYAILAFINRRWGRIWFVGVTLLAAALYVMSVGGEEGMLTALRVTPLALAALIGLDLLFDALFAKAVNPSLNSAAAEQSEKSARRYHNFVNRIEALAIARERARIAREFHDTLGHTLTTLDVQMELMVRLPIEQFDTIQVAARQSRMLVKEGLADVRRSIRALHPNALRGFSIVEALQGLVDEFKRTSEMGVVWRIEGEVTPLPPHLALPLHRAAQEALTNVRRHAGATEVRITLALAAETIGLTVEDNGRAQTPQMFGFGLSGIRDRVQELCGHFEAGPRPEGGFRLIVRLPR